MYSLRESHQKDTGYCDMQSSKRINVDIVLVKAKCLTRHISLNSQCIICFG